MSRSSRSPWFILFVIIIFIMASPMTQFKVPPILPVLMKELNFSASAASMLMSVFALTGIFLGIPAGFIFRHAGIKVTSLLITSMLVGGAILGIFSNSYLLLLISRFIEGIGLSLCSVIGPPVVAHYFPGKKLSKAMGLMNVSVPVGLLLMFTLSPLIEKYWNWHALWLVVCIYSLAAGIFFFFKIDFDDHSRKADVKNDSGSSLARVFTNKDIWLMTVLIFSMNVVMSMYLTWFPSYAHLERGLPLTKADLLTSIMTVFLIISGPLGGWLCDRLNSRKAVLAIPFFFFTIVLALTPSTPDYLLFVIMIILGLVISFVPTALYAEITDIVKDRHLQGIALGITIIGQNTGMITGPLLFGLMIDKGVSWGTSFYIYIPAAIIGGVASMLIRGSKKQVYI